MQERKRVPLVFYSGYIGEQNLVLRAWATEKEITLKVKIAKFTCRENFM